MYDYEREVAEEHESEILEAAEEHRRALLVRCCSGVARFFRTVKCRFTGGKPCDE